MKLDRIEKTGQSWKKLENWIELVKISENEKQI